MIALALRGEVTPVTYITLAAKFHLSFECSSCTRSDVRYDGTVVRFAGRKTVEGAHD